jgi:citrate lyase subunit beta / citryl-CoA lyase
MLAKATQLDADELVVDLEDAVAADAKEHARALVVAFLPAARSSRASVAVRINSVATAWGEDDVAEIARRAGTLVDSLVVPKVECADDVSKVQRMLDSLGRSASGIRLQALIETAAGLLRVGEIAAASPRLEALILGYADLAASLGRAPGPSPPESWLFAQETALVAARAAGLQMIDGPYLAIRDLDGLRVRAQHVRTLGFDGKWAVHPDQLPVINSTFTPGAEEVSRARAILEALEDADGRGAVELDGQMIDEASRKLALQVIARGRAAGVEGLAI